MAPQLGPKDGPKGLSSGAIDWLVLPGLSRYEDVHRLQKELVEKRVRDEIPDTIILCEHAPVITRGRGLQFQPERNAQERARPLPQLPIGTDYVEIERGGDLTWHGPGQLVSYPIVKLGGEGAVGIKIKKDIDAWIRFQERVWMRALANFGVESHFKPNGSGVWIRHQGLDRKWVSVGVALKKWVNYHGTAANIVNDSSVFLGFDPCGFSSEVMIRAADLGLKSEWSDPVKWREKWQPLYQHCFMEELAALVLTE